MPDTVTCSSGDCKRPAHARGLCESHYRQFVRTGETKPLRKYETRVCDDEVPMTVQALHRIQREIKASNENVVDQLLAVRAELTRITGAIHEHDKHRIEAEGETRIARASGAA